MVETMFRAACLSVAWTLAATGASAGAVRCWFENGSLVVPAAFGEIAGDFIVDLSQAGSRLHETPARAAGIVDDEVRGALDVAGETVGRFPVSIANLDGRAAGFTTNISGVLGADAFRSFVVELSFDPCRFVLRRHANRVGRRLARLAVSSTSGRPAIRAAVSDGVTSREGWFLIDTSSRVTRITDARLSRPPRALHAPVRLRALSLAGMLFEQVPAEPSESRHDTASGSIGTAVWSKFSLRLDQRHGWLDLYPAP